MSKKIIQRALPLNTKYQLIEILYQPGDSFECDNCGRKISNVASIENIYSSRGYYIGLDCLDTLLENNKLLDDESYDQYINSDKPAIVKAKALRAKILKRSKEVDNFNVVVIGNTVMFGQRAVHDEIISQDPAFVIDPKYKEFTLNYIQDLINFSLNE